MPRINRRLLTTGLAFTALMAAAGCTDRFIYRWLEEISDGCHARVYLSGSPYRDLRGPPLHAKYHECRAAELANQIRQRAGSSERIATVEDILESEGFLCAGDLQDLRMWDKDKNRRITCAILAKSMEPGYFGSSPVGGTHWVVTVEEQKGAAPIIQVFLDYVHKK